MTATGDIVKLRPFLWLPYNVYEKLNFSYLSESSVCFSFPISVQLVSLVCGHSTLKENTGTSREK